MMYALLSRYCICIVYTGKQMTWLLGRQHKPLLWGFYWRRPRKTSSESKLQRQENLLLVPNLHSLFTRLILQFVRRACLNIGLLEDAVLAIVRTEENQCNSK
jgi:hypothetical protein